MLMTVRSGSTPPRNETIFLAMNTPEETTAKRKTAVWNPALDINETENGIGKADDEQAETLPMCAQNTPPMVCDTSDQEETADNNLAATVDDAPLELVNRNSHSTTPTAMIKGTSLETQQTPLDQNFVFNNCLQLFAAPLLARFHQQQQLFREDTRLYGGTEANSFPVPTFMPNFGPTPMPMIRVPNPSIIMPHSYINHHMPQPSMNPPMLSNFLQSWAQQRMKQKFSSPNSGGKIKSQHSSSANRAQNALNGKFGPSARTSQKSHIKGKSQQIQQSHNCATKFDSIDSKLEPAPSFPTSINPIVQSVLNNVIGSSESPINGVNFNTCAICRASFRVTSDLVQHMRSNHRQSKYKRKNHEASGDGNKSMCLQESGNGTIASA
ncbi:hypothetical protein DdX_07978 [Ditylenchus destructor]|uniref:C2H2-type domain-containing protein n=1 Tax=Ditylenchus destructor TaxID=166010 RepID=A0AAD4N5K3_9BILA|nr:hypothetical protein DdX_07978 [Ditylenchus destructor]